MKECDYDVIIIGSGIAGLISGVFLAKAGLRVAIFERHYKVGGCCSSFKRGKFIFDSAVHGLADLNVGNSFRLILKELGIDQRIRFVRPDRSDRMVFRDFSFDLGSDIEDTISQLQKIFLKEAKHISAFFKFIREEKTIKYYYLLRNKTFKDLLDEYFSDLRLKQVFYILIAPTGTMPLRVSALSAVIFLRNWIVNGRYYPLGGMQKLADVLLDRFQDYGGKVFLSSPIEKIIIKNNAAAGVILAGGRIYKSSYVVSNADARQTFFNLVGKRLLPLSLRKKIQKMLPALSSFLVYLGLDRNLVKLGMDLNIWYFYDIKIKDYVPERRYIRDNKHLILVSSSLRDHSLAPKGGDTLCLMKIVPFRSEAYWNNNKIKIMNQCINIAESLIPGLSDHIVVKAVSTPATIYKYTRNYKGAIGGWALLPDQVGELRLSHNTVISNLYLAGHWTFPGIGVHNVARSGEFIAKKIIKNYLKEEHGR